MRSSWVPIVGIVFFSGAFLLLGIFAIGSALVAGTPVERLGGLVGGSAALVAVLGPWYFFIRETLRSNALLRVLGESHGQLGEGHSIWFDGAQVDAETELARFQACISFIFPWPWGMKLLSSYYAPRQPGRNRTAWLCSIVSLVYGWLGVWTIVWVVTTLVTNSRGGHKISVRELLAEVGQAQPLDAPPAAHA